MWAPILPFHGQVCETVNSHYNGVGSNTAIVLVRYVGPHITIKMVRYLVRI
jgi:hypothetical protein